MDVGVGSFVFSLGITSAFPFIIQATSAPSAVDTTDAHSGEPAEDTDSSVPSASTKTNLFATLIKGVRKSLPIWLLGIARVIMVKKVDYPVSPSLKSSSLHPTNDVTYLVALMASSDHSMQEHMTEYGVHWNFFFTLGSMPLVGTILGALREAVYKKVGWKIRFRDLGLGVLFRQYSDGCSVGCLKLGRMWELISVDDSALGGVTLGFTRVGNGS